MLELTSDDGLNEPQPTVFQKLISPIDEFTKTSFYNILINYGSPAQHRLMRAFRPEHYTPQLANQNALL